MVAPGALTGDLGSTLRGARHDQPEPVEALDADRFSDVRAGRATRLPELAVNSPGLIANAFRFENTNTAGTESETGFLYGASRFRIIEGSPTPPEWLEIFETDFNDPLTAYARAFAARAPQPRGDGVRHEARTRSRWSRPASHENRNHWSREHGRHPGSSARHPRARGLGRQLERPGDAD